MRKRVLSSILAIAMLLSLLPTTVFAAGSSVAEVNGQKYSSLTTALSQAPEGGTVKLLADVNWKKAANIFGSYATDIDNLTLDLNGNTLTVKQGITVKGSGNTLTITDNAGTGKIISTGSCMFTVKNAALDLRAGTYDIGSGSFTNYAENPDVDVYGGSFTKDVSGYLNQSALPYTVFANPLHSYYATWEEAYAAYRTAAQVDPNATIASTGKLNEAEVTVTLDYNYEGADTVTYTTTEGTSIELPSPERAGYTFSGWSHGNQTYQAGTPIPLNGGGKKTFTAVWTANQYTVTFNGNGGTVAGKDTYQVTKNYGVEANAFADGQVLRNGAEFLGWARTADGNVVYTPADKILWDFTDNTTVLYAIWDVNQFTITYHSTDVENDTETVDYGTVIKIDPNGGTYNAGGNYTNKTTAFDYPVTENIQLAVPNRDGYTFLGWTYANGTFTAKWNWEQYNISFLKHTQDGARYASVTVPAMTEVQIDPNGGTYDGSNKVQSVEISTDPYAIVDATRSDGYNFTGWKYDENTHTFTAQWDVQQYTVYFHGNGGTVAGKEVYSMAGPYGEAKAPFNTSVLVREGYTFQGWATTAGKGAEVKFAPTASFPWTWEKEETNLYAVWTPNKYTVTFDGNGGTVAGKTEYSVTKQYGENAPAFADGKVLREGAKFLGWSAASNATVATYGPRDSIHWTFAEDTTLYAVWDVYDLTFQYKDSGTGNLTTLEFPYGTEVTVVPNGGSFGNGEAANYTKVLNQDDYLMGPDRSGYTFLGWTYDATTHTFTAQWEAITYTVTFDANGGTFAEGANTAIPVPENGVIGNGNAPEVSREGYNFAGWYGEDKATPWSLNEGVVQSDVTLYAGWIIKEYSFNYPAYQEGGNAYYPTTQPFNYGTEVVVDPNGGTYYGQSDIYKFVIDGSRDKLSLDATATKEGYTFVGWKYEVKDGANTFTAMWAQNQITITFHGNGGTNVGEDLATQTMPQGVYAQLAENRFTCTGYTFAGWNTKADGTGTAYGDKVSVNFTTNVDLYAMWTANQYTITYNQHREGQDALVAKTGLLSHGTQITLDLAGGTLEGWGTLFTLDQNLTLPDPWKSGCTFDGWLFNGESNTFTAQWKDITYTVTFDANGGEGTMTTQTFQAGVPEALNENTFTRTNYHFVGWSENADAAQADIQDGQIFTFADQDHSRTLYAIWALDTYDFTYYKYNADGRGNAIDTTIQVTHGSQYYVDPNGGTYYGQSNKYSATVTEVVGTRTLDNTATRPGYTFDGWQYYENGNTYVAQWKANPYTVTFMNEGATYYTMTVNGGEGIHSDLIPVNPTLAGKNFLGWYLDGATTPYDFNTPVTGDITLYAVWEDVEYTVTFIGNGGSNEYRDQTYPVTVLYNKSLDLTKVPAFTRQGYVFLGWSTQRNHAVDYAASVTTLQVNGDMTLYAVWAQVVDFGTIPYGTGEQHVKTIDYQNGIVNVTNQGDFNAVLDGNDSSRLMISPTKDMAPSNEVYSTIMRVDFDKNNMTQYVQAMVKISQQEMEISTNMSEVEYYTVGDSFTVYVTAAPGQNLTLDVGNAADALKCTQELQEVAGTSGTYTAVYEVVSIPSDARNLQFTVMDAFGNTAAYQETINLRTEVIVTVNNVDGTQVSIPTMYLGTDEDSGNSKQLPLTWNEDLGKYTALADKASGWDYVYFQTADGREVFLRNTTVASESITEGIQANDGLVEVEYTFGGYTIAGNLYINDVAVPNVSLRISGNYGDAVDLQQLINQAWQPIVDRYPNAKTDKFDISVLLNGSPVQIKTFGETNYDWGSDNTIYVNVYATAGYHVDYDLNWQDDSNDVVYTEFVKHGETATGYANPPREGFKFAGWYVDPACTTAYDFTQPVTNNMILYAKWEANVYLVQFNNGYGGIYEEGTPWAPQEIPYNGILSKPTEVPTRPGYTFNGWYLDPEGTEGCFNGNGHYVVTTDMVIYAGWKQNDYWLVYHNVEDASNANQFQSYKIHYGDVIRQPVDPIREGYTFQGWYLDEACTEPATFPITVGETQVDLYAKWAKDCQVAFFYYHYAQGDGEPANVVTVPYGGTVEDPGAPPAVSGYIFDGWYTNTDWTQKWDFNTPVTRTMHLYAKWVEAVTVTFNLNGGTSTDDADGDGTFTLEIAKGSALPDTLATPAHPTFVFGAWYADADQFSDPWNMEAPITGSMTLTAGWEKATGVGKFFNTTQTSTYVMIRVQDANGNWQPATGIEDLTLSAKNQNGFIFVNVHMQEILPESPNWQSDWDPDYAYYTASFASTPLTGSGQFALTAAGYDFTVSV